MHRLAVLPALLLTALFARAADSVLVFNEIQYHPLAGGTEWIELRSLQGVDVDIAGWRIEGGVDYKFPPGTIMPGGGHLVVAATPGQIPGALGPWAGQLDNAGETLRLLNLNGRIMDEVSYSDSGSWPIGADGSGASLSRRHASAASGAGAWTASKALGGTPGAENFPLLGPVDRTLVTGRTSWRYRDADAAPPADWAELPFNDGSWTQGNALFGTPGGNPPALTVTANLVERFRASAITGVANGAVVATWFDGATGDGVSQNAVAGTTTPTYRVNVTPSGKAAVRFDGIDESRTTVPPGIAPTGGFAYFIVLKGNGPQTNGGVGDGSGNYIFDRSVGGNPLVSLKAVNGSYGLQKRYNDSSGLGGPVATTPISTTAFQIVAARRNRTLNRFELWVNGVMEGADADTGAALTPDPINIGRHATGISQGFNGDIAELLIYRSELSDADFQAVGSYLETEYGLDTAYPGNLISTPLSTTAPTSYFRKTFTYPGDPSRTTLRLSHTVADGAVFYLNGSELTRANMPGGAVTHTTPASSIVTSPATVGPTGVPVDALLNGTNVLAVSLHKAVASPGVLFDAALESTEMPPDPDAADQLRFNEIAGAGDAAFHIELRNVSGSAVSTAGWTLKASTGQTVALPAQSVPAGEYLVLNAAALGFTPNDGAKLFLLAPGGAELRDSREVTNRLRGLLADGTWGHPDSATPGAANVATVSDAIVINEIFYHAPGTSAEQWIELYNKSAADVDIGGWKFSDGVDYQFAPDTMIAAGGYRVIAWDPAAFATLHPGVTALGPWSGNLSRQGETITLRDANDNIVDQLTYAESGRWSEWADGGGSSLELKDAKADNARGESWDSSDESSRSTWQTVTAASYQGVASNPAAGDPTTWNEFVMGLLADGECLVDDISVKNVSLGNVELIQNGTFSSGTSAFWRIIGNQSGTVVDDPTAPGNKVLKIRATGPTEHMHNHAGTTLKQGASYHAINAGQTYNISFRAKWLRGSNRLHTRLYANRLARQTLLNRPSTGGTPGAINSRAVGNIGPTFDALAHSPVVPAAGVPATVSVRVADSDGIAGVQLFTSVNGTAFTLTKMNAAGDGLYTADVPAQAAGALVQFYIRAADVRGAISFFPAAGPASRAMIPWRDNKAILQFPSGARAHNVRIVLPAADATELYKLENVMSNGQMPCTVIYDEREVYYQANVRLRASEHARFNSARVGFILGFGGDELFLGAHSAVTVDRSGGLAGGQREIMIKTVSNVAGGIHAPEDDIIRVIAPVGTSPPAGYSGATLTGPAIFSKTRFDDSYLDNQWPDGGSGPMFKYERMYVLTQTINPTTRAVTTIDAANVLTAVSENPKIPQDSTAPPGVAVANLGAAKENYRWYWLLENAREADDYSGLINVVTAVGQTGGTAAFNTQTAQHIDVSTWLRSDIPSTLFGVVDNYLGAGGGQHNALIYFPPGGKGVLIPWDLDFLDQSNAQAPLTNGADLAKFLANPVYKRTFYSHLLDILNRSFNTTFLTRWAQHYSRFGTDDMTTSLAYLTARAQYAMNVINGTGGQTAPIPFVTFARTSTSPVSVSTPFATVSGVGWINVAQIRLLGSTEPLAVTWTGQSSWTLQLPIGAGTRTYTLVAYSTTGAQVGSTSVTVNGTGGVFPADAGSLVVSEVNYNPSGSTDATEFLELLNITGATLDLSGCHFDEELGEGIAYTFPPGVQMPPGGRLLVVRDRAAFIAMYPTAGPLAPNQFTGALDNSGEEIVLYAASGLEIFRFSYGDNLASTDGGGKSLVRVLSSTNPNPLAYPWRESTQNGGNPGSTDALAFTGSPSADIDVDGAIALLEYACGTSDNDPGARPPQPQFIFNANGTMSVVYQVVPNADDVITTVETSSDLASWAPVTGPVVTGQKRYFHLRIIER